MQCSRQANGAEEEHAVSPQTERALAGEESGPIIDNRVAASAIMFSRLLAIYAHPVHLHLGSLACGGLQGQAQLILGHGHAVVVVGGELRALGAQGQVEDDVELLQT